MTQENSQNPITKAHLEGVAEFEKEFSCKDNPAELIHGDGVYLKEKLLAFLTTYGINLLNAAKEAGPKEKRDIIAIRELKSENDKLWIAIDADLADRFTVIAGDDTFNSCRSSYRSAIDEGIKEITKGDK